MRAFSAGRWLFGLGGTVGTTDSRPYRMEALVERHFGVEFGKEISAGFQCLAGASLGELGEEFAALRIACLDEFDRLTLDVGEFLGPALL